MNDESGCLFGGGTGWRKSQEREGQTLLCCTKSQREIAHFLNCIDIHSLELKP